MTYVNDREVIVLDDVVETPKLKRPHMYKVVLINDDTTPMDFVCNILETFFNKSPDGAYECMMEIHITGSGLGGIYTKDISETKKSQITKLSTDSGYQLKTVLAKVKL